MSIKKTLKQSVFRFAERYLNIHITPVHFYSPIPKIAEIDDIIYSKINNCEGIDFNLDKQKEILNTISEKYLLEFIPTKNTGLSELDAFVLYSLIREKRPRVFIEIGSGETTKITLKALKKNQEEDGYKFKFTAIEPYPKVYLRNLISEEFELIEDKVQNVNVEKFKNTDVLFIDSSHVSKIGSDVNYEMLHILPVIKVGAIVHWHDIMLPGDYPKLWIEHGNMFWNESYMVQTFMMFNKSFKIIWAAKYMQLKHPNEIETKFSFFKPNDPDQQLSSFWIERIS